MNKYAVHINKPSIRGFRLSVVIEAASPQKAQAKAEAIHGVGSVIRVVTMPVPKR